MEIKIAIGSSRIESISIKTIGKRLNYEYVNELLNWKNFFKTLIIGCNNGWLNNEI